MAPTAKAHVCEHEFILNLPFVALGYLKSEPIRRNLQPLTLIALDKAKDAPSIREILGSVLSICFIWLRRHIQARFLALHEGARLVWISRVLDQHATPATVNRIVS